MKSTCAYKCDYPMKAEAEILQLRAALQFLIDHSPHDGESGMCLYCDMGGAGYSSKGDGHHDDKEPRDVCPVVVAIKALNRSCDRAEE